MSRRDYRGRACSRADEPRHIRFYVVPNTDKRRGGWMPVYRDATGREHGDTYGRGFDRGQALRHAKAAALLEARRYRGDWCVTVKQGTSRTHRRDGSARNRRR